MYERTWLTITSICASSFCNVVATSVHTRHTHQQKRGAGGASKHPETFSFLTECETGAFVYLKEYFSIQKNFPNKV